MVRTRSIPRPLVVLLTVVAFAASWVVAAPSASALPGTAFVSTWNTTFTSAGSSGGDQIKLPLDSLGTYDFIVEWGDGEADQITAWNQFEVTHTYDDPGIYTLTITGELVGWRFPEEDFQPAGDRRKILSISSWGTMKLGNTGRYFWGAENLVSVPAGLDLTGTTDLSDMFAGATVFTGGGLAAWDVSQVTDMRRMFQDARVFNEDIGAWDVRNVTNTADMFYRAASFNQDVGNWDVRNVTNMGGMFDTARAFDQDLSGWDVSSATNTWAMFADASAFNADISGWDVSKVTMMEYMFKGATSFDQDIGGWDVGSVTTMRRMFSGATSFDRDLSRWDVTAVTDMDAMFAQTKLSRANYDALLNSWSQQSVQPDVVFGAGSSQYSSKAVAARQTLVGKGWDITDGGQISRWFAATPDSVAYGPVPVGESASEQVVIENVGSEPLLFSGAALQLSGPDAERFSPVQDTCSAADLNPGRTCVVELLFEPGTPGVKTATMTLAERSGEPMPLVPLAGTGMGPAGAASPAAIDFGNQRVRTLSDARMVTLTNSGNEPLHVTSVEVVGEDAVLFPLGPDGCTAASLDPGQQCQVAVRFRPTGMWERTAVLRFHDNAVGSPQEVPLTGTGVVPWFVVAPFAHDFGDQQVGTASDVLTMTVMNTGNAVLQVGITEIAGPDADQFTIVDQSSCAGKSLAPQHSCTFGVRFKPTTTGAKTAWLKFSHDGLGALDSALAGTGTPATQAPEITAIDPSSGPDTGGNRVLIKGRHLAGVKAVRFGGVAATVVGNTDTEVRVTAPKHAAGRVDVTVVTAGGSDTVAGGYRYVASPVPPGPPTSATYTPGKRSTVRWAGAANATGYQVKVNEGLVCTTAADTSFCAVAGKLGPNARVLVRSTGAGGTSSAWVTAKYRANPVPVLLATVHFPPFSARLTAKTKSRLRQVATLLEAQGFRSLVLTGHTARIPGKGDPGFRKRLSKQRAVAVKRFLQRRLDEAGANVRISIRALGGRHPVGDNNTRKGRAKNRFAQVTLT